MERISLKEQQLRLREDVILQTVNSLLAQKGYDLMTVDEVAAQVGLTKPSLYKHFKSKEALAAAAMVRLLDQTAAQIAQLPAQADPIDKLRAVLRWALQEHLRGAMPLLPSTRSALRDALMKHKPYVERLTKVSDALGGWIEQAQAAGQMSDALPPDVILFTLFARTCDPVLDYLKLGGNYGDEQIVEMLLSVCFDGLLPRAVKQAAKRAARRAA